MGLPDATAMVVGIIIGARFRTAVGDHAPRTRRSRYCARLGARGSAHARRRVDLRRALISVPAHGRRVRVPARHLRVARGVSVGLGDVLEHAHRHHRGDRRRVRAVRRVLRSPRHDRSQACRGGGDPRPVGLQLSRDPAREPASDLVTGAKLAAIALLIVGGYDRALRGPRQCRPRIRTYGQFCSDCGGTLRLWRLAHGDLHRRGDRESRTHDPTVPRASGR